MTEQTTTQPAKSDQMSLEDFIRLYNLPPNVPLKRACEILNVSPSQIYKLKNLGIAHFRKNGRSTELRVTHLYDLTVADAIASVR